MESRKGDGPSRELSRVPIGRKRIWNREWTRILRCLGLGADGFDGRLRGILWSLERNWIDRLSILGVQSRAGIGLLEGEGASRNSRARSGKANGKEIFLDIESYKNYN